MSSHSVRTKLLEDILQAPQIDLQKLRNVCFGGIPDEGYLRPVCWRLLLNYLPLRRAEWPEFLRKQRKCYEGLVLDIILNPSDAGSATCDNGAPVMDDHPLNPHPTSVWCLYFKDNEVLSQIDKDVRRLCPEMSFFQQATEYPCRAITDGRAPPLCDRVARNILQSEVLTKDRSGATNLVQRKVANEEYNSLPKGQEAHWQVVERILFVYSKLNPGVSYVQGMNEILGPLYYVFAVDLHGEWKEHAEADAFFCFQNLMSEIKDYFISKLDESSCGIDSLLTKFYDLLAQKDAQLHRFITTDQELLPQYYAFRWISLLLSQEFLLPDVIRIWDSLFADERRFEFLLFVCVEMLKSIRNELLVSDFVTNMKLLQKYPTTDIGRLLIRAAELRTK